MLPQNATLAQFMSDKTEPLYYALTKAGIPTKSYQSDLYFPDTPKAREILAQYPVENENSKGRGFINQVEGGRWIDVPFAYSPFWEEIERKCKLIREANEANEKKE